MRRVLSSPESHLQRPTRASQPRPVLLYVEDDDDNFEVAEYRLSGSYDILRAAGAQQACALIREQANTIHAILMDIELRGSSLNGIQLTELFRGKRPTQELPHWASDLPPITRPIIFVTAHGARYTDVELMLFGADKVIAKPVDFTALQLALGALDGRGPRR